MRTRDLSMMSNVVLFAFAVLLGLAGSEPDASVDADAQPEQVAAGPVSVATDLVRSTFPGGPGRDRAEGGGASALDGSEEVRRLLVDADGAPIHPSEGTLSASARMALHTFYEEREYRPAWTSDEGLAPGGARILRALEEAYLEGIDPGRYEIVRVRELVAVLGSAVEAGSSGEGRGDADGRREEGVRARLDVLLAAGFLALAEDLARGVLDPREADSSWRLDLENPRLHEAIVDAAGDEDPADALDALRPSVPHYSRLMDALARYRARARDGGWARLPFDSADPPALREGNRDRRVVLLRFRLRADEEGTLFSLDVPLREPAPPGPRADGSDPDGTDAGDERADAGADVAADSAAGPDGHEAGEGDAMLFDATLADALRHFQERHGLVADGVLGPETLRALNVPVEARVRALELNLDRWRWVPRDVGSRYVLVNVAGFTLDVMEDEEAVLFMRVVVGAPAWETPSFRDQIRYLVLNPYWYVPVSIARREILPQAEVDEAYLERNGYERTDIERAPLRQRPVPGNPLGGIKFMFPNAHNIYLHDTPTGELFDRSTRAFSHGCIRLEKPWKLAEYLLRDDPGWDAGRMRAAAGGTGEVDIALPESLPIYILYFTAEATPDGIARFHADIYDRDRAFAGQRGALASGAAAGVPVPD
ncbi:MAG: L,D-transpeptidase family protein [Gemmatimonadota bacterium]